MTDIVLSPKIHKALIQLCEEFGTGEEARKDPEFILEMLLDGLNRDKGSVSSVLRMTLRDNAIGYAHVRYWLEERAKSAA